VLGKSQIRPLVHPLRTPKKLGVDRAILCRSASYPQPPFQRPEIPPKLKTPPAAATIIFLKGSLVDRTGTQKPTLRTKLLPKLLPNHRPNQRPNLIYINIKSKHSLYFKSYPRLNPSLNIYSKANPKSHPLPYPRLNPTSHHRMHFFPYPRLNPISNRGMLLSPHPRLNPSILPLTLRLKTQSRMLIIDKRAYPSSFRISPPFHLYFLRAMTIISTIIIRLPGQPNKAEELTKAITQLLGNDLTIDFTTPVMKFTEHGREHLVHYDAIKILLDETTAKRKFKKPIITTYGTIRLTIPLQSNKYFQDIETMITVAKPIADKDSAEITEKMINELYPQITIRNTYTNVLIIKCDPINDHKHITLLFSTTVWADMNPISTSSNITKIVKQTMAKIVRKAVTLDIHIGRPYQHIQSAESQIDRKYYQREEEKDKIDQQGSDDEEEPLSKKPLTQEATVKAPKRTHEDSNKNDEGEATPKANLRTKVGENEGGPLNDHLMEETH